MSIDAAFILLRRANPEPDLAALRAQVERATESTTPPLAGNNNITTAQHPVARGSSSAKRTKGVWSAAPATFGIGVVLGFVLLALVTRSGSVGFAQPGPVEIAERYLEAHNMWDPEAAKEVLAVDSSLIGSYWEKDALAGNDWLEGLSEQFEYNRIMEHQYSSFHCTEVRGGPPALVACDYQFDSILQKVVGHPASEGRFFFSISDGLITAGSDNFPVIEFMKSWEHWRHWLVQSYPNDFELIVGAPAETAVNFWHSMPSIEALTPEALTLLEERVAEYTARGMTDPRS